MPSLFSPHEPALTVLFSEVESAAAAQAEAFLGTPGTLDERSNENGTRFWVHRYSDAVGRRVETYLGKLDDPEVQARVDALRTRIDATMRSIAQVRILARAGFATVDRKLYSTLASLHNHGLFRAGALLIGSHAYGALLNALGVKAVAYKTEDVDIARREALALPGVPPFIDMLRATGIEFFEVPRVDCKAPSTSFAEPRGRGAPSHPERPPWMAGWITAPGTVPRADDTQELSHLSYLLNQSQEVPILSPHGAVTVRVPVPERYAVHKLIVSQLRASTSSKAEKDLKQAATLIAALVERFPGAIEDALSAIPKSVSKHLGRALIALERHLPETAEAAWDALIQR